MVYRKGDKYQNLQSRSQYVVFGGWFLFYPRNISPQMNFCVAKSCSGSTPSIYPQLFVVTKLYILFSQTQRVGGYSL